MRIAINGNRHQEGYFDRIDQLVGTLLKRGHDVVLTETFYDYLTDNLGKQFAIGLDYMPLSRHPHADLAISIGGDGAFLKTARWIGEEATPIAGINTGHLGYLSAFTFEQGDDLCDTLLGGRYSVEPRTLLRAELLRNGEPVGQPLTALNEIAITRGDNGAMLHIETQIGANSPLTYIGDGLIIATPTGSTAYNLSVGGPVLAPELHGWVLAPVAAHSLSMRPLVVSDSIEISIKVDTRGNGYRLSADGKSQTLPLDTRLRLSRAPFCVNLIVKPGHAFTDTLRDKLGMKGFI